MNIKKIILLVMLICTSLSGILYALSADIYPAFDQILNVSLLPQPEIGNTNKKTAASVKASIDISGLWESNNGWRYNIKQQGIQFTWVVINKTQKASGTINDNKIIDVAWIDQDSKVEASGTILDIDTDGKATFIEWDNGDFFYRENK